MKKKPLRIIVFGNEKGGTGKSTLGVHATIELLYQGKKVLAIDCDGRQGTFSHYLANRESYIKSSGVSLPVPRHTSLSVEQGNSSEELKKITHESLEETIVIDTPGSYNSLAATAHKLADLLVTPVNESYIDLDLLVRIEKDFQEKGSSNDSAGVYANEVWGYKIEKASSEKKSMDWLVVKNRESSIRSKNKDDIQKIFKKLSERFGFRLGQGFKERAIFRQLFPEGLTISDYKALGRKGFTVAHVSARQELRRFMKDLLLNA